MPRKIKVKLPTLHDGQVAAFKLPGRFKAVRCGRRWGKTEYGKTVAADGAIKKESIGWFAPEYKLLSEAYNEIVQLLEPVKLSSSKVDGVIRTISGGRIDFWTLENEQAGRSRKYHKVIIDEGAFTKPVMMDIWNKSIRPTLLDYGGSALVLSNTNGADSENFFWRICNEPEHGFSQYHAPTHDNPLLPLRLQHETLSEWMVRRHEELSKLEKENHPLVFQQEYRAEFVDWSGISFFERNKMLIDQGDGTYLPLEQPDRVDVVFAIVDTAVKTGKDNDGTAVTYFSYSKTSHFPLCILDWDIAQIEGAMLETWLPTVFQHLEYLATQVRPRLGSIGAFIEDQNMGTVLLQHAVNKGWPATAIDSVLTSLGKDGRAISTSTYVYRGMVKYTKHAYDKTTGYKNQTRNHSLAQVLSFRVGDKAAATRADDLLDCFCYGIALSLGDSGGF